MKERRSKVQRHVWVAMKLFLSHGGTKYYDVFTVGVATGGVTKLNTSETASAW